MQRRVKRLVMYTLMLLVLALIACVPIAEFVFPDFMADLRVLPRLNDVSTIQEQSDALLESVIQNAQDELIEERVISSIRLLHGRMFAGCIRGATELVYGSIRNFSEVLDDYADVFTSAEGWTKRLEGTAYISERADLILQQIHSSDLSYTEECENFPVCYTIRLNYADPSLAACLG